MRARDERWGAEGAFVLMRERALSAKAWLAELLRKLLFSTMTGDKTKMNGTS
jgi:hypothetical protein